MSSGPQPSDFARRDLPPGFRELPGGLVVPDASSRQRVTWDADDPERRAFERAFTAARRKDLSVGLVCQHQRCRVPPFDATILKRVDQANGYELVCNHLIRWCPVAFGKLMSAEERRQRRGKR